jgi:hypothetical protein
MYFEPGIDGRLLEARAWGVRTENDPFEVETLYPVNEALVDFESPPPAQPAGNESAKKSRRQEP